MRMCGKMVAVGNGYHFRKCGLPAKWDCGDHGLRCGKHSRQLKSLRTELHPDPNFVDSMKSDERKVTDEEKA